MELLSTGGAGLPRSVRVRALLDEATRRLQAGQAGHALELVVRALQLCEGQDALLPVLSAALRARAAAAAGAAGGATTQARQPAGEVGDLADLFSKITMHAEQVLQAEEQGQPAPSTSAPSATWPWQQQQQQQQQQQAPQHFGAASFHHQQQQQQQQWQHQPQQQQQQWHQQPQQQHPAGWPPQPNMGCADSMDTDGSHQHAGGDGSFVCAACGGVVAARRREQHERFWCPVTATGDAG